MAGIGLNTDTRNNSGGLGLGSGNGNNSIGLGMNSANNVFTPYKLDIPKLTPFSPGKSALSTPLTLSNMFGLGNKEESAQSSGSGGSDGSGEGSSAGSYSTSHASNTNTITNTATTGSQTQNLTINQTKDANEGKNNVILIAGAVIVVVAIMGITMVSIKKS